MSENERPKVGDRVQFDGKRTRWLVRAESEDGRYQLATASLFGDVVYTILDFEKGIRGPMNVIGWGLGIFTTSGPDEAIDAAMAKLKPEPTEPGVITSMGGFEVSHRNNVPIDITKITPAVAR